MENRERPFNSFDFSRLLFAFILFSSVLLYFLPYLVHCKYLIAEAVDDDSIYTYYVITKYLDRFQNDVVGYLIKGNVGGSIVNYGSLFLANIFLIPILWIYQCLMCLQLFSFPILLVLFLKRRFNLTKTEMLFSFYLTLISGYAYWNFANYGMPDVPYPGNFVHPFAWLSLYWLSQEKKKGYFLLSLTCLIHASIGLYAILAVFVFNMFYDRSFQIKKAFLLAIPFACAIVPPMIALSGNFPRVNAEGLEMVMRLNMHATPWASPFTNWYEGFPNTIAFMFLIIITIPRWNKLGKSYRTLLVSTLIATVFLCISHLIGYHFGLYRLVQILGLRSPTLMAIVILPILILFFMECLSHESFSIRFTSAWIVSSILILHPYGLDKTPIMLLGLLFLLKQARLRTRINSLYLERILLALVLVWSIFRVLHEGRRPNPFSSQNLDRFWNVWDYFKYSGIFDYKPGIHLPKRLLVFACALFTSLVPFVSNIRSLKIQKLSIAKSITFILCLCLFMTCTISVHRFKSFSSQYRRDLYNAQLWAKNNTDPYDRFLTTAGAWRSISERAAFQVIPQRRYFYYPDRRIKQIDDLIIYLLGLREEFKTYNLKQWYFAAKMNYYARVTSPEKLRRLGEITGCKYLVEERDLKLPQVYGNKTFKIYDLSQNISVLQT